jgi:predicted lipid-binding transport protein (Tim44 family)
MKRDTLKTIAGLIIIGLIVVVTFLYGNAQRQSQNRKDQAAKQAQQQKASTQAAQPQAQPKVAAAPATPAAPATTSVPDTGAGETALIPVTLLVLGLIYLRRSRRALAIAIRQR